MKRQIVLFMVFFLPFLAQGQVSAITQFGEKVILYDDFTWDYAENEIRSSKVEIKTIEIDTAGMVRVTFVVGSNRLFFYDGRIFSGNIQNTQISYHDNSFFAKSVGKIKQITINAQNISFEYHENFIFDRSEGKIKQIKIGKSTVNFDYHENSFFTKSVGKIKEISRSSDRVTFEYFENSIYGQNEGKLKEARGEIPGINIVYLDQPY